MLLQMIRSVTAAGILLAAAGVSGADETQQEYFILSRPVPATATGTVDYAKVTTLSFEAKGRLSFVETPGTLARGNILDLAGNLAVPGDLLAEQDTELPESDVKIAEARLRQAEALLREKQSNYQRDQELLRKNAVSRRQYEETLALYESAVIDRDKSKLELERARQVVEHCRIRAPYRAVVLESYQSEGASVDVGDPILKIAMIDPVRIRIALPPESAPRAAASPQITVVALDGTETSALLTPGETAGAFHCDLPNPWVVPQVKGPDGNPLPTIDGVAPVRVLTAPGAPFWVPANAVHSLEGRTFVWKFRDNRADGVTALEQIAIEPADVQLQYGDTRLRGIRSAGLKRGDLIALEVPEAVQSGAPVVCLSRRHRFLPGEEVKVRFSVLGNDAFFSVPETALQPNQGNSGFHVVAETEPGKFTVLPVTVLTIPGAQPLATAPELKPGMRLRLRR